MAWLDHRKTKDGTKRYRIRDRRWDEKLNRWVKFTAVPDVGRWKEIAQTRLDSYEKAKAAGNVGMAEADDIDACLDIFLNAKPRDAETRAKYRRVVESYKEHSGAKRIKHLATDPIIAWLTAMRDGQLTWTRDKKKFYRYSPHAIEIFSKDLKAFCNYCRTRGWLGVDPFVGIAPPEDGPEPTRRFLTRGEAARLLKAAKQDYYLKGGRRIKKVGQIKPTNELRRLILFGLYTGVREGEARNAHKEHIYGIQINGTMRYVLFIPKAKRKRQRTIVLHPRLVRILGIAEIVAKKQTGPLFPGWSKSRLAHARMRAVRRAGLQRVRYHDMRHTFIRNFLVSQAGDSRVLAKQTGHSKPSGLDPYSHFAVDDLAEAIPRMEIV